MFGSNSVNNVCMFIHFLFPWESGESGPGRERMLRGSHLWVRMAANHDGDGTRVTVTQDGIDFVECHAVNGGVIDLHQLIAASAKGNNREPSGSSFTGRVHG